MLFDYKKYEEAFPRKKEPQQKQIPAKDQPIGNALEEAETKTPDNDPDSGEPEPDNNEGGEGDGTE